MFLLCCILALVVDVIFCDDTHFIKGSNGIFYLLKNETKHKAFIDTNLITDVITFTEEDLNKIPTGADYFPISDYSFDILKQNLYQ